MSLLAFDLIKDRKALFSVAALARLSFQGISLPPVSLEKCRIADVCWGPSSPSYVPSKRFTHRAISPTLLCLL